MSRPEVGSSRITKRGPQREDAGKRDPPQLASGKLVRVSHPGQRVEPDRVEDFIDLRSPLAGLARRGGSGMSIFLIHALVAVQDGCKDG
jgi:hypothetical protein